MSHVVDTTATTPRTSGGAGRSRGLALLLAFMGLVGMFFTLLGWTGHVRDQSTTWGASPLFWVIAGAIVVVGMALADAALGVRSDFVAVSGRPSGTALFLNRLLPWAIVALTAIGMVVISLVHG